MNRQSLKKILILVCILALPGFLYNLLKEKGKNRYKPLPILGPKELSGTSHSKFGKVIPDTNYHHVKDFKLIDINGDTSTLKKFEGQIMLVNLFYKGCGTACDKANQNLASVLGNFSKNKIIHAASITVDPTNDTQDVLKAYAQTLNAVPGKWDLLRGNENDIYSFAKTSLFLDALKVEKDGRSDIVLSNMIVLIDEQRRIRGYYDGANKDAMDKLTDEIKVLIAEELRNVRDGR